MGHMKNPIFHVAWKFSSFCYRKLKQSCVGSGNQDGSEQDATETRNTTSHHRNLFKSSTIQLNYMLIVFKAGKAFLDSYLHWLVALATWLAHYKRKQKKRTEKYVKI